MCAVRLSAAQLSQMRSTLGSSLPGTCVIYADGGAVGTATGFYSSSVGAVGTVACRLSPVNGSEQLLGDRVGAVDYFTLTVPYDTTITEKHRAIVDSQTFEIVSVDATRSYSIAKRCTVRKVV